MTLFLGQINPVYTQHSYLFHMLINIIKLFNSVRHRKNYVQNTSKELRETLDLGGKSDRKIGTEKFHNGELRQL
jgi:hypothetical protein